MDKQYEAPKGRLLPTIVLFVFVLGVLYTLFLLFEQYSLNRSINKTEADIGEVQLSIESMRSDQIEELYVAQELTDQVEASMTHWSKVVKSLQDLTPVTIFFSSYGASEDGSIQLSGLGDGYGSVADLITVLNDSDDFEEVFVPSVTLGTTSDGQEVASFSLQLKSSVE